MRKVKVGIVSKHPFSEGGVSSYTRNLVCALLERGVDVVLFSSKPDKTKSLYNDENSRNVCVCWSHGVWYPFQIFRRVVGSDVGLIHVQHEFFLYGGPISALLFPLLLVLLKLVHKPVVVTLHGVIPLSEVDHRFLIENELSGPTWMFKLGAIFLVRTIVFIANAVIVHEKSFVEALKNDYKCISAKINVIPHGVGEMENKLEQDVAKEKLGLGSKKLILFFGYISKYKGIETLINGFGHVAKKHGDWFLIVGGGEHPRLGRNSSYQKYVTELRRKASLLAPHQIMFTGFIPEERLSIYFSAADLVVFPYTISMSSSGPLALAMSYGRPIIASDIPSIRELIPFEECLFEKDSTEDLVKKLELMLNNYDLRRRMVAHVEGIRKHNSWSEAGLKTCTLYQKVRNSS